VLSRKFVEDTGPAEVLTKSVLFERSALVTRWDVLVVRFIPMSDEEKPVSIHISADGAKRIPELFEDLTHSRRLAVEEMHGAVDRALKVSEIRIAFYEKLILLAGGSFALSLTF
jgi:ribosomal protein S10